MTNTNGYKIIISGINYYREIKLPFDADILTVGTKQDMDIRLRRDLYFGDINICFQKINNEWMVFCSDNIYFNVGDVRKLLNIVVEHGSHFNVCYQNSGNALFTISFLIDFDEKTTKYDVKINLSELKEIQIGGGSGVNICIDDYYVSDDYFSIKKVFNGFSIENNHCSYGLYVNDVQVDNKVELNNKDFISMAGYGFYFDDGWIYTSLAENIRLNGLYSEKIDNSSSSMEYPKFIRNTRLQHVVPDIEIEIQQPAGKPTKTKKNIIITLIPSIVMFAMIIILRGLIGGGGIFVIYSAVSMGIGIVMSCVTYKLEGKDYKETITKREKDYTDYIEKKKKEISEARRRECIASKNIYRTLDEDVSCALNFGKDLFDRALGDKDFLHLYLGKGKFESVNQVKFAKQEYINTDDELTLLPEKVSEEFRFIDNMPITIDLYSSSAIGITGDFRFLKQMLRNILIDLYTRHFFNEVKFVVVTDDRYIDEFAWIRWLRNIKNENLDLNNIVCDEESRNIVLEYLYTTMLEREQLAKDQDVTFEENYIVFVTNTDLLLTHPMAKYVRNCCSYGFTFVFLEENEDRIPIGCNYIIRLISQSEGKIIKSDNSDKITDFTYSAVSNDTAIQIADKLAPVYVAEVSLESQLRKNISMFELMDILSVDDLDVGRKWNESKVYVSMAAPIGIKANNDKVMLDISDVSNAHGPHGLVAGTTGSGKSEILQTYILSMATLFHPYDVGFLIIDFKGGGMANQFVKLPHLIGTITNIDGREINRSLQSIKAELVKRQEVFSKVGVNHINEYIKLYKTGKTDIAIPHLIIVVDEFAELKAEFPDFMKELISAARIGRTLGVHLILATQKPAGVVDSQIWSNSKFKLCLKVQTKEDSNEVIKSPLAAEIVESGRAYFQVGNNEIFDLIQSAYSGAQVPSVNGKSNKKFTIYERNIWGKKVPVYNNKNSENDEQNETQLDALVNYIDLYCKAVGIVSLPGICLPPLKDKIFLEDIDSAGMEFGKYVIPVGMYDNPSQQKQDRLFLELSKENVYIVGSAQSGKTMFLQSVAYELIKKYTPSQVNMYIIDCGSMVLKIFEEAAHVGGVVLASEEEKCRNLFKLLNTMVIERKQKISLCGVGNYNAYIDAGYDDFPLVVVMIDNMAAFKEYFENAVEQLNSLTRDAQGVGISFIISATATNAMSYKMQANFAKKLSLNCNDVAEYSNLFGHCRITPKENAGRGLCVVDKVILEWQAAIFGSVEKEVQRSIKISEFITKENEKATSRAMKIPMVPDKLILKECMTHDEDRFRQEHIIPVGMNFDSVDYDSVDITRSGALALIGDDECRLNMIKSVLRIFMSNIVFYNVEAVIFDDKNNSLNEYSAYGFVDYYSADVSDGLSYIEEYIKEKFDVVGYDEDETFRFIIINNADMMRIIMNDKKMSHELSEMIKKSNSINTFILVSQIDNVAVGFNSSEVLKTLRECGNGILFAPIMDNKFFEIIGRIKADDVFDKSIGYHFENRNYKKIKLFE